MDEYTTRHHVACLSAIYRAQNDAAEPWAYAHYATYIRGYRDALAISPAEADAIDAQAIRAADTKEINA